MFIWLRLISVFPLLRWLNFTFLFCVVWHTIILFILDIYRQMHILASCCLIFFVLLLSCVYTNTPSMRNIFRRVPIWYAPRDQFSLEIFVAINRKSQKEASSSLHRKVKEIYWIWKERDRINALVKKVVIVRTGWVKCLASGTQYSTDDDDDDDDASVIWSDIAYQWRAPSHRINL